MYAHFAATMVQVLLYDRQTRPIQILSLSSVLQYDTLTLSAKTRNMPKSSNMAHCVTIFRCSTRRMAGSNIRG